jgi:hypothetical protein
VFGFGIPKPNTVIGKPNTAIGKPNTGKRCGISESIEHILTRCDENGQGLENDR